MHCNYITLRALAVQLLLILQTSLPVMAEELSEEPTLTVTTTRTTLLSTLWVVVTNTAGTEVTYTTTGVATGSTIGIATIAGSTRFAEPSSQGSIAPAKDMAWQAQGLRDAVLNSTNLYRSHHEAKPLTWNASLASYAQDYADGCKFQHSGGSSGENLAQGYASPTLAIDAWANEESDYNYVKHKFSDDVGHFTQLVWKNTTTVGCGAANCDSIGWLLVCEYNPAGNVIGEFGSNVGKPGQGADGEPGIGDSDGKDGDEKSGSARKSGGARLLIALVAVSVFAGFYV